MRSMIDEQHVIVKSDVGDAERDGREDGDGHEDARGYGHGRAEECDWKRAHAELVRLAADQARLEWEVGRGLLRALRSAAPWRLGYASMAEYAHRLFGYEARFTSEKLRAAEMLEELPELNRALREGEVTWSVVRELTRVATPATEGQWLAVARGRVSRDVEKLVSGHRPGNKPDDPRDPSIVQHVLRFEVRAETRAVMREALAKLRREAGGRLDDDAALLLMARQVLGGPKDAGRASYQLGITKCDECRRAHVHASGELVEVGAAVLEMAECDAQHIGSVSVGDGAGACSGDDCSDGEGDETHVGVGVGERVGVGVGVGERVGVGAVVPAGVERQGSDARALPRRERATQSIPPAVRRLVVHRDQGHCQVPGCHHAHWVDVHHIHARADGGGHDPDGLVLLCGAHHDAVHRGELLISGRVSAGLRFQHADGAEYGGQVAPRAAEARTKAFHALRNLGFGESHVKRAFERIFAHVGAGGGAGAGIDFEAIVRQSLAVLTP